MVLITEEQSKGLKVLENGVSGGEILFRTNKVAMDKPVMSITNVDGNGNECEVSGEDDNDESEVDYRQNYWEDEDEVYQEFEELDFGALPDHSDTQSVASDDSFYPHDNSVASHMYRLPSPDRPKPVSFFKACCNNNTIIVKIMIRQGVTEEEVTETDRNRRVGQLILEQLLNAEGQILEEGSERLVNPTSGLIVACYHGYVDVAMALSQCPYLDVNWQDNEGNTALIIAAQAGKHTPQTFELQDC
ncbi:Ankyrin repeat domain-containing protein 33B [Liparis tanakae]|uniref:Ankyrin repeat domain-containing protein 33B n=1 Tax=Liparis tanakae TaxID=230148 RepID=A0A4Z2EWE1_9TELE|nr:Ankyrin repeat domain-containing protein 33B [Liparis tanakae]